MQENRKHLVQYVAKDGQEIQLSFETVKRYLVRGRSELVTSQELVFFMGICKSRGLNPFAQDCYLIKYAADDPAAIIVSIDYLRAAARSERDCQGWTSGCIVKRGEEIVHTDGLVLEDDVLIGGWAEGQPKGWTVPHRVEVNLKGCIKKTKNGRTTRFWQPENQPTMIEKVAEARLLRKLWSRQFARLYIPEEMGEAAQLEEVKIPTPDVAASRVVEKLHEEKQRQPVKDDQAFEVAPEDDKSLKDTVEIREFSHLKRSGLMELVKDPEFCARLLNSPDEITTEFAAKVKRVLGFALDWDVIIGTASGKDWDPDQEPAKPAESPGDFIGPCPDESHQGEYVDPRIVCRKCGNICDKYGDWLKRNLSGEAGQGE